MADFSKLPYVDDFNADRGFQQVLFKPGLPVQTRELNTLQSILHNQTNRLSQHIFKLGSRVNGSPPKHIVANYVTLADISPFDGLGINLARIIGCQKLRGQTSKIEAVLLTTVSKVGTDPYTLYVKYTLTGIDNKTSVFINGEIVDVIDNNNIVTYSFKVRCPTCPESTDQLVLPPTGKGVLWQVPDSVYYAKGYFINHINAMLVGEKYVLGVDSYTVGLDIVEDVVTSDSDSSLLDNALGYPNYKAPGADRYRVSLIATIRTGNVQDGDNFITLAKVVKGEVVYINDKPQYADLMDLLAERTYDESGNYTVHPFKVSLKEHLRKTVVDPFGVYTLAEGGDENKFVAVVSPGRAYVLGYQVRKIAESLIPCEKARDTKKMQTYYNKIGTLNYILIKPTSTSAFFPTDITKTSLFTNEKINLYDNVISGGLPTGTVIGTLTPFDVEYDSGTGVNTVYKLYFTDMTLNAGKTFNLVKSMTYSGTVTFLAATVNDAKALVPKVYNADQTPLLWDLGKQYIKSLMNANNSTQPSLTYTTRRKYSATLDSLGKYTWTAPTNEYFDVYSNLTTLIGIVNVDTTFELITVAGNNLVISPTELKVDLGASYNGKKVLVIHNIIKTNVSEKIKTLTQHIIPNGSLSAGKITATKTDLYRVVSIMKYSPSTPTIKVDVKEFFSWTTGQTDVAYVPIVFSKLSTAPSWDSNDLFEIIFEYYEHGSSGDYFSVDSYSNIVNDPAIAYGYEDIPSYTSVNNIKYDLRTCLDFRPVVMNANPLTTIQPSLNGTYNVDCETYLPRTDLLVIDKDGNIYQKKGISSDFPVEPKIDVSKEMAIYKIVMNPYVFKIQDDIRINFIENKRYTMRDIGRLEQRISNVEYYTSFTTLESNTASLSVKDANGLDRFKNGFVVDDFRNYQAADLTNIEFKAALDRKQTQLRPPYKMIHSELVFDSANSTHFKQIGNVIMIDHDEELFVNQPYSSKSLSVNPYFIFNRKGKMVLAPSFDNWADVTQQPNTVANIDAGMDTVSQIANKTGMLGTEWGAWSTVNETILSSETIHTEAFGNWARHDEGWLRRQDTLSQTQTRTGVTTSLSSRTDSYNLGDRVTDVKLQPYMRSRDVQFYAGGLKPNTRIYCFFDGVDVTAYCRPITSGISGTSIIVDSKGVVRGIFNIPANRFFNGQKTFRITNSATNSKDEDVLETEAEAVYWAGGLDIDKQSTTLNVVTPVLTQTSSGTETQEVTTTRQSNPYDPVAETFTVDKDCFLTSIDVYFSNVAKDDKIFCQIKNTENGYPGPEVLTEVNLKDTEITTSTNASIPTNIKFPFPVFVQANKDYAVIVGGENPETRLWISKLGENDVTNPSILIDRQPSLGTLFKSQNNKTWTASQFEDLKFKLYRAKFKYPDMTIVMKNKPLIEDVKLTNPIETELGSNTIRIHYENHSLVANDKVKLNIGENTWLNVIVASGQLAIGHILSTVTGTGTIKDLKTSQNGTVDCQLTGITGYFTATQSFSAASFTPTVSDNYIATTYTRQGIVLPQVNFVSGTINQTFNPLLNGVPLVELNSDTLTVFSVDSIDSFIIKSTTNATATGRTGGDMSVLVNKRYEVFNISGSVTTNNSEVVWSYRGLGHSINGQFSGTDYVLQDARTFNIGDDNFLDRPYKFAYKANEDSHVIKSINVSGSFTAKTLYDSPVLNLETFSFVGVSNKIDYNETATYNVAPNASNRLVLETDPSLGSASFKYVTRPINLKNPALDIKIMVDVYKPTDSDFDFYIKKTAPWDSNTLDSASWIKITGYSKNFISKDLTQFTELDFVLSEIMPVDFGVTEFNSFRVKIVGKSKNPANPPLFQKLRIVALT